MKPGTGWNLIDNAAMELMRRRLRYSDTKFFNFYHLHYYFSKDAEMDGIRKAIIDFKNSQKQAIRDLIIESIDNLRYIDIDNEMLVVRALNSLELKPNDKGHTSLDRLGAALSSVFDCDYFPAALFKRRLTPAIKSLNILQRHAALDGAYGVHVDLLELYNKILIIDDIITTGTTVRAIAGPIIAHYPDMEIIVFALAWTPTARQQEYIHEQEKSRHLLSEPEIVYKSKAEWFDADYEFGDTHVSVFDK